MRVKVPYILSTMATTLLAVLLAAASCSKNGNTMTNVQPTDSGSIQNKHDTSTKTWLALGDSYTIGTSIARSGNYPTQTAAILSSEGFSIASPVIIATNGWTTVNLLDALSTFKDTSGAYNIVTVLIGVNDLYQGGTQEAYATNFTTVLQKAIAYAGNKPSHVIVISIPDYSVTPFGQANNDPAMIAALIDAFNSINLQISQTYQTGYLDVTGESRKAATDPSLIAGDQLHFTAKEYAIWSALLAQLIATTLK